MYVSDPVSKSLLEEFHSNCDQTENKNVITSCIYHFSKTDRVSRLSTNNNKNTKQNNDHIKRNRLVCQYLKFHPQSSFEYI